jgi:hypothetical protein
MKSEVLLPFGPHPSLKVQLDAHPFKNPIFNKPKALHISK